MECNLGVLQKENTKDEVLECGQPTSSGLDVLKNRVAGYQTSCYRLKISTKREHEGKKHQEFIEEKNSKYLNLA